MSNEFRVAAALDALESVGALVGSSRGLAQFTQGMEPEVIRQQMGSSSPQMQNVVLPLVAGTAASGGTAAGGAAAAGGALAGGAAVGSGVAASGGLLSALGNWASLIGGGLAVADFLQGLGDDAPRQAVESAGQDQHDHERQVREGCESADLAVDGLKGVDDECARSVEEISSSTVSFVNVVKSLLSGPQALSVSTPVIASAVLIINKLLSMRNSSLGRVLDTLIEDFEPAALPGRAHDPVCTDPAPAPTPEPDEVGDMDCPPPKPVEKCPSAEAGAGTAPSMPAGEVAKPVGGGAQPAPPAQPVECVSPVQSGGAQVTTEVTTMPAQAAPPAPPVPPAPAVPPVSVPPNSSMPCPPAVPPQQVAQMIQGGMAMAAGAWQQFMGTVDDLLCPPPEMPGVGHPPQLAPEPVPEPVGNTPVDCATTPEPVCEEPAPKPEPEPCSELEPEPCPESGPEPTPKPEPCTEDAPEPEPEPESASKPPLENTEQGFDKSKHPSVPADAVQPAEEGEPDPFDAAQPAPEASEPASEQNPDSSDAPDSAENWTPDIWVGGAASVDVQVEAAAHASAGVHVARSGQW